MVLISLEVNGTRRQHEVEPRHLLVQYIRETLGLTGTNIGCDTSSCGACTVLLNGESVKSCTLLAAQADEAEIVTIEGLSAPDGALHPVQEAFRQHHALQCGYCTPGMVMAAVSLLAEEEHLDERGDEIAIGALARHHDLETSALLKEQVPLLAFTAHQVGDPQVRHRGTLGGTLAHGDPASDLPAAVLALGGTLVV